MGNLSHSFVYWNSKNCSTLQIQLVGLSTPLYLGKSILANFGVYEFWCSLVFLARFLAVESSPESSLCMSSIDAVNFFVCSIEACTDSTNFFVCSDEDFMKPSNIFCKLEICYFTHSGLGSAIGKEFGFDTILLHECVTDLITQVKMGKKA
jgi:hypothetical protein